MEGQVPGLNKEGLQSRKSKVQANGQKAGEGHHRRENNFRQNIEKSVGQTQVEQKKKKI